MFLLKEFYKQYTLHHSRDIAGSHSRALSMIPHCCLPWEPGPCLSPSVADHPLRSAKDPRLGAPFPHQLSNLVRAHPYTITDLLKRIYLYVWVDSHMLRTRSLRVLHVQLACVKPIASVHSEPGSNSYVFIYSSINVQKRSPSSRRFPYGYLVTTSYQSQYLQ
jgi:hypothetical protein